MPRVGQKMAQDVAARVRTLPVEVRPVRVGDVYWPPGLEPASWTAFRVAEGGVEGRPAESIPLVEVKNAALAVLARVFSVSEDELLGQLMRIFGISRRGNKVVEHFKAGIALAVKSGRARREGPGVLYVEAPSE